MNPKIISAGIRNVYFLLAIGLVFSEVASSQITDGSRRSEQEPAEHSTGRGPAAMQRALLDKYCVGCHNQKTRTAGLALDKLDTANLAPNAEIWEKVVQKLRTNSMPPAGLPRPDKASYTSLTSWLESGLDRAAAANPNPGRPLVHRLNRNEYTNAIRDLLDLEIDGRSLLPADDSS